jgi:hypothetical protein
LEGKAGGKFLIFPFRLFGGDALGWLGCRGRRCVQHLPQGILKAKAIRGDWLRFHSPPN